MNKNYIQYKKILYSARGLRFLILFIAFFFLFGLLGMTIATTYDQTVQKDKQLSVLEEDLKREQDQNAALKAQKQYYESDTYIEKEARDTLGLSYPNEQIYILKKNQDTTASAPQSDTQQDKPVEKQKSILDKWLELIFG